MKEGDQVDVQEIRLDQHFTEPPPRFSEASLTRALEEMGSIAPDMDTLSMGMTNDLEAAIAEGSTILRVGTGIFGSRNR